MWNPGKKEKNKKQIVALAEPDFKAEYFRTRNAVAPLAMMLFKRFKINVQHENLQYDSVLLYCSHTVLIDV